MTITSTGIGSQADEIGIHKSGRTLSIVNTPSPITGGEILYWNDSLQQVTTLSPGTTGQVLTTNGLATPPSWATAGNITNIGSDTRGTAGTSLSVSISQTGIYKKFVVCANILKDSANITSCKIKLNADGGANYNYQRLGANATTVAATAATGQTGLDMVNTSNFTSATVYTPINFSVNNTKTTAYRFIDAVVMNDGAEIDQFWGAWTNVTDDITAISITTDQNMKIGSTMTVWGLT